MFVIWCWIFAPVWRKIPSPPRSQRRGQRPAREAASSVMDRIAKLVSGRLKARASTGPHPGPELLTAFAENALPEADRGQLLQHLGACSDCREILYLALPVSVPAQKVLVLQPRPFRRWALGWGALVASVAIAAVFFPPPLGRPGSTARLRARSPPAAHRHRPNNRLCK